MDPENKSIIKKPRKKYIRKPKNIIIEPALIKHIVNFDG